MAIVIRENPKIKGFKVSYMFKGKCKTKNFYYSNSYNQPKLYAILKNKDNIAESKGLDIHRVLEVVQCISPFTVEAEEL